MTSDTPTQDDDNEKSKTRATKLWEAYLSGTQYDEHHDYMFNGVRRFFRIFPSRRSCKLCNAPFDGPGSAVATALGFGSHLSRFNPTLCDRCEKLVRYHQVGVETQMTLLFADVRGSTTMAEQMSPAEFHNVINRFYQVATEVMVQTEALIDKLVGDEVIGLYTSGIAGKDYAQQAIKAAVALLKATGHGGSEEPWLKIGAGVHTGLVYAGAVGSSDGQSDITVLGDTVNTTARLASQAQSGEALVSKETCQSVSWEPQNCEVRLLQLKGRSEAVEVYVLNAATNLPE